MGKTLTDIAQQLLAANKEVQLIYVFNGTGTSHSTLSNEAMVVPTPAEQATVKLLTDHLKSRHIFWQRQGA